MCVQTSRVPTILIYLYNILGFVRLRWCPVVLSIHPSCHPLSSVPSSVPMTTTSASLSLALNPSSHPSLAIVLWPCPLSGLAKVTACLQRDKYLGLLCPHSEHVVLPCCFTRSCTSSFCYTSSLLALTCDIGAEGGFCISYRLFSNISHPSSSGSAPRSDRATTLQVDEEANHGHYLPLSNVCARIPHRSS
jgi:hypothetical protein